MTLISVALVYIQRSITPVALLWIYSSRVLLSLGPLCWKKPIQWLIKSHHPFHLCVFDPWKMSGGDSLAVAQMVESFPWLRSLFFRSVPFLVFPCWHTLHTRAFFYLYNNKLFQPSWVLKAVRFFHWQFASLVAVWWQVIFVGVVGARAAVAFLDVPRSDHAQLYWWLSPLFSSCPVPLPEGACCGAEGIYEPWTLRYLAFCGTELGKIGWLTIVGNPLPCWPVGSPCKSADG